MKINSESWILGCESLSQKQELLAYAKSKGISLHRSSSRDNELAIGWNKMLEYVYSFSMDWLNETGCVAITSAKFRAMCDEYAKPFKLPRKLKRELKNGLMKRIDKRWQAKQVQITSIIRSQYTGLLRVNGYKLG